mgnify:FL=1
MKNLALFYAERKNLILALCGVCAVNILFLFFVLNPLFREIAQTKTLLGASEANLLQLDQQRSHFLEIQKTLVQNASVLNRIEDTVVDLKSPLPFIELLETLAREQDSAVQLSVIPSDAASNEKVQNFQISVSGGFLNVYQYLKILESIPYQMEFTHLSMDFTAKEQIPSDANKLKNEQSGAQTVTRMVIRASVKIR